MEPKKISPVRVAFPADVDDLMPDQNDIPEEHWDWNNQPWSAKIAGKWFYHGLDAEVLIAKSGIDKELALNHLQAVLGSFSKKHEYKMAAASYLIDQWFEPVIDTA